jgi:hypothetical protein
LCAKYGVDPPDAVIAALAAPSVGTTDTSSDTSTTPETTSRSPESGDELQPDDLGNTMTCLLQAAAGMNAVNAASARPLPTIAERAGFPREGARNVRDAVKELKEAGLWKAREGKGGGYWITAKGLHYIGR